MGGESAFDLSGSSVSLSANGTIVAIGSTGNDGDGIDSGHVRVYDISGTSWRQLGQDIDGENSGDRSGNSVSLSSDGSRLAVGAIANDGNGFNSGHVRVYEYGDNSSDNWEQLGQDIDGEFSYDQSGWSISMSSNGTRVAIGSKENDGNGSNSGHVRVYEYDESSWNQIGQDIDGKNMNDLSGYSVSLSSDGSKLAIGSTGNDGNGIDSGHVRVYDISGTSWRQLGQDIDGENSGDRSGWSVSMSADGPTRVAIGAVYYDGNGSDSGHVRVYEYGESSWAQLGDDINGENSGDRSGWSVSMSEWLLELKTMTQVAVSQMLAMCVCMI